MTKSPTLSFFGACSLVAAGAVLLLQPTKAGTPTQPVLAELFTSQGCSSCPEADKIWAELQKRNDVVALSFSIDYWDYIGWKDTLARHENTLRQQAYSKAMPSRQVYTPQVIVDGVADVVGNERAKVISAIDARSAKVKGKRLSLNLTQSGSNVEIRIAGGTTSEPATVWVAHTASSRTVNVTRGENAGHMMTYTNVVRDFTAASSWSGQDLTIQVPARAGEGSDVTDGVAVWVQQGTQGQVLGAAQLRLAAPK